MAVVLITNGDIKSGQEIAHELYYCGADIIFGTKCAHKANALIRFILNNPIRRTIPPQTGELSYITLDLDDLALVKLSITQIVESRTNINFLIMNHFAAVQEDTTIHNFNRQTQINFLSTCLITLLIVPKMKYSTGQKKIITAVNADHTYEKLDLEHINFQKSDNEWSLYMMHNRMIITFLRKLESKVKDLGIAVQFVNMDIREVNLIGLNHIGFELVSTLKRYNYQLCTLEKQCSESFVFCVKHKSTDINVYFKNGVTKDLPPVGVNTTIQNALWLKTLAALNTIPISYSQMTDLNDRVKRIKQLSLFLQQFLST